MTSTRFVFTLNNYETMPDIKEGMKYLLYGKEIAPTTWTPHLQGFVIYKKGVRISKVIKDFPGAHIEIAKGTSPQCIEYCKKDGDFVELGTPPASSAAIGEAEAKRWELALESYIAGDFSSVPADIGIRYGKGLEQWSKKLKTSQLVDTEQKMEWYYGPSGTGKSRRAREENPGAYLKMCNKWWDDYSDQDVVIIEDFDSKHEVLGHHLKIWADRYPFPAEVKGGKLDIRPAKIIVTSNYHPRDIWHDPRDLDPILRRFRVTHFDILK